MYGPGVRNLHSVGLLSLGYISFSARQVDINGVCAMIVSLWSKVLEEIFVRISVVVHDVKFERI